MNPWVGRRRPLACRHLAAADPALAALIGRIGPCGLAPTRDREPYDALVHAIAHQQLHGRAAEAILGRLAAQGGGAYPAPEQLLGLNKAALRACGFSCSKAAALHDLARQRLAGVVPSRAAAARLSDDALIERLSAVRGIGRWTVEMLLIFTLGRPDVLPVDDFGVREGYRRINGLEAQPKPRALAAVGAVWAPYRSTAAWYLWRAADEGKAIKSQPE